MITVGLLGGKGYMGSALLPALHAASKAGKLELILLLRASSRGYPTDVESRIIDLEEGDVGKLRNATAGLNFVVASVSPDRRVGGKQGLDQLLPDRMVNSPERGRSEVTLSPERAQKGETRGLCEEQRSAHDTLRYGHDAAYHLWITGVVWDRREGEQVGVLSRDESDWTGHGVSVATTLTDDRSKEFDGAALVHLLTERTHEIANRAFSIVEQDISQEGLIEALTKIQGTKPEIVEYSHAQYEHDLQAGFSEAMAAAGKRWFGVGVEWPGERVEVPGWRAPSLEKTAAEFA